MEFTRSGRRFTLLRLMLPRNCVLVVIITLEDGDIDLGGVEAEKILVQVSLH